METKTKTTPAQFELLVEFMEKNGDLSKPNSGPHGRQWTISKWTELAKILNSEGMGASKSEEKWRKVWTDMKMNVKKKWSKIRRSAQGTGGGPATPLCLTEVEERVLAIIGVQAAEGIAVPEVGFEQQHETQTQESSFQETFIASIESEEALIDDASWNTPGTHREPTRCPPPVSLSPLPAESQTQASQPPTQKKRKLNINNNYNHVQLLLELEKKNSDNEKERDRMFVEMEREKLRVRDLELQLQAQWLQFLKEAFDAIMEYLRGR